MTRPEPMDDDAVHALFGAWGDTISVPRHGLDEVMDVASERHLVAPRSLGPSAATSKTPARGSARYVTIGRFVGVGKVAAAVAFVVVMTGVLERVSAVTPETQRDTTIRAADVSRPRQGQVASQSWNVQKSRRSASTSKRALAGLPAFRDQTSTSVALSTSVPPNGDERDLSGGTQSDAPPSGEWNAAQQSYSLSKTTARLRLSSAASRPRVLDELLGAAKKFIALNRTGALTFEVVRTTLAASQDAVTRIAKANSGVVTQSESDQASTTPHATLTIRIPPARFDATMRSLDATATVVSGQRVTSRTTKSSDVTGEYIDLEARLRTATVERDRLLAVLGASATVSDIATARSRLNPVQTEVERTTGRIDVLINQASLSTIVVTLHEAPLVAAKKPHTSKNGFRNAWSNASNGLTRSLQWLLSHAGAALVATALLIALSALARSLVPRIRRGAL